MNFDALGATWAPRLLSILRIMSGLLLLQHGTGKLLKYVPVHAARLVTPSVEVSITTPLTMKCPPAPLESLFRTVREPTPPRSKKPFK